MPSFDVVSEVNMQEVRNAVDQTQREVGTRYDLKDAGITIELDDAVISLSSPDKMKLAAVQELLKQKLAKRGVSLKSVTFDDPKPAGGDTLRQVVTVKQSLNEEERKRINRVIKDKKLKVTSQIQGEQIRVTGKKRDDLQEMIAMLKQEITDIELQFTNFRE